MRLVTRKLWRAFPELDGFADEQCRRFVEAANSRWRWRLLRWMLVAAGCLLGVLLPILLMAAERYIVGVGWLSAPMIGPLLTGGKWQNTTWGLGVVLVCLLGLSAFVGMVTRDIVLRLRIRGVVRVRGVCLRCHYALLGLPIDDSLHVACPECGHRTEVDPSMAELTGGGASVRSFAAGDSVLHRGDSARRWRLIRRTATWVASVVLALAVVSGSVLGVFEVRLRSQAVRARALPTGVRQLAALMQAQRGAAAPASGANAFELLADMDKAYADAEKRVWPDGRPDKFGRWGAQPLDPSYIYNSPAPNDPASDAEFAAGRDQVRLMIAEMEGSGVFEQMAAVTRAPVRDLPISVTGDAPLINAQLPGLGQLRLALRWSMARAAVAAERNDAAAVGESVRTGLALARMADANPWMISRLSGAAMESMMLGRVGSVLMSSPPPDAAMVAAIDGALKATPAPPSYSLVADYERVWLRDLARWVFADASRSRWGRYNPTLRRQFQRFWGQSMEGGLGSLEENLDEIEARVAPFIARASQPRPLRTAALVVSRADLIIPALISVSAYDNFLDTMDQVGVERAGTALMVALERHRLEKGGYLATLAELAPAFVAAVPADPWTGKPFCYRRLDPKADPHGRGYLLYSIGGDGVDNGGTPNAFARNGLIGSTGTDYIINDPDR